MDTEYKPRVNASMMNDYIGKPVCFLGTCTSVDPSGMSFKVCSTDNQTVNVQVSKPIQGIVEGMVEVMGKVTGRNSISCFNYTCLSSDQSNDFNSDLYNEALQIYADNQKLLTSK